MWGEEKKHPKMKLDKFRCFVVVVTEHVLYWQNMLSDIGILWEKRAREMLNGDERAGI